MDTFGKRLISARSKLNLTQKELAEKLGITPTRLNYYEKDKREPDISMIKKISSALNVDPNFLVGVWSEDQYEDFENAKTDADRLYLLNKWGAPSKLSAEYRSLSSEPSSSEIDEDDLYLLELFHRASDSDQEVIRLLLQKYEDVNPHKSKDVV